MKKIFYKIFFILIIVTYMPLIIIYGFNSLYVNEYIKKKKAKYLKEITEFVNINSFSLKYKKKIEETEDIKIDIIDLTSDKPKTYIFEYLNKRDLKIDIEHMKINESIVKFVKRTNLLNNIYIIKKVDKEKFIVISSLMVVPEVISHIILSAYFYVTALIIPVLFILTYFISKKMSKPIELLEEVSKKMSNLDFSKKIEFKSDDELTRLGRNINNMAEVLKNNIDELSLVNKKLKKELETNEKLMKFEKNFMNSISHELKTPIAIINGYIEMLQDKIIKNPEEIEKIYAVMFDEGVYLNKMIKDLNSYHRYESNFFKIEKREIRIKDFITGLLSKYHLDIEERKINLIVDIEDKIIIGDLGKLSIILNNLLTNAISYTDKRGIIEINYKNNNLRISNSAEIISEEKFAQIFQPFYKIDFSRNRKYGGTGLGLSIVKNILELLHLEYNMKFDKKRNFVIFDIRFN
ncbi:sensor histidine kinase [Fusobacterium varium]